MPLGANMPLAEIPPVAARKHVDAVVLSGAIEPSSATLKQDLPGLVQQVGVPGAGGRAVLCLRLRCDLPRAGAIALGRDIYVGLTKLEEAIGIDGLILRLAAGA